ncbi:spore germination protein GerPC [Cohnella cellulosilytica]|uniref:Spore germination protein GerPC n=2 Tax=Cohnella cellulosilytica TaxID=986710 RepID=A0ABW2F8X9_9BACL
MRQSPQPNMWSGVYQSPQPGTYPNAAPTGPAPNSWSEMTQRLCLAENRLKQMTDQLTSLQQQLDEIKSKPPLHVEYHFDQLKVNRLEGTLNVGIAPQGAPDIESLETPGFAGWKAAPDSNDDAREPMRELQQEMAAYMDGEAYEALIGLERQFGISLGEELRSQIVSDVKRQLNERVHYYVRSEAYPVQGTREEQRKWREAIKEKTMRDVQGAFVAYLSKQQQIRKTAERG